MLSFGFPPMASPQARTLILGSLPGQLSLARGEYYANPHNAFWKIIARRFPELAPDYASRGATLAHHGIALWDVLAAATRSGSLDTAIRGDAVANNFRALFHAYPKIRVIYFNGAMAGKLYARHVLPTLTAQQRAIARHTLPSTSAAHASLTLAQKAARWSVVWQDVDPV
jgi:hypoxanthine-DNA glycosylase